MTALELRDPDPVPRSGDGFAVLRWTIAGVAGAAAALRGARAAALPRAAAARPRCSARRCSRSAGWRWRSAREPDDTPKESLPNPARIFASATRSCWRPSPRTSDDPRRDPARQTADGRFRPGCPGRTKLSVTSGFETTVGRRGRAQPPGDADRAVDPPARLTLGDRAPAPAGGRPGHPRRGGGCRPAVCPRADTPSLSAAGAAS